MSTFPFSQDGLDQKLAELYKLPDESLKAEAGLMAADFRNWLSRVFVFSEYQALYLIHMDNGWLFDAGQTAAKAIINRLPIYIEPPIPEPPPGSSKYVRTANRMTTSHHPGEENTVTGYVTYIIEYV